MRHLTEPLAKKHLEVSGRSDRSKTKKKGRKKRGASLERMIAKMILQSSTSDVAESIPAPNENSAGDDVTTRDILSDLVKANDSTSAISGHSKETTPWVNTAAKATHEQSNLVGSTSLVSMEEEPAEVMEEEEEEQELQDQQVEEGKPTKKESSTDAFGFVVDDGWTAFDDCPAFDTSFFPSNALDDAGFPISTKKETAKEERRSGPVDLDDDFDSEAEEEELAAELRKEMEEEIAKEKSTNATVQKQGRQERSAYVASQVTKLETSEEEEDKLRLIEEEIERKQTEERAKKQREEERLREEQYRLSREIAKSREDEHEQQEQNLAKELARRIAKEQEWGKLQEMAQELARKQMDEEKYQELQRQIKKNDRPPFTLEEVEVADRDSLSDDDVSSLPTTQSLDSRSLSQFLLKENGIPPVINEIGRQEEK